MSSVRRYDQGELRGVENTPHGGLRVAAAPTRVGVFPYQTADGQEVREYRSPEEVFSPASLATLRGVPVTDLHPAELVTADTWRKHACGHVGDDVKPEGSHVVAHLYVDDAAQVARIRSGERRELSCGYECEIDKTPGTSPEGERYDQVQRAIRYNHVALGPEGWGRGGSTVALRLDGAAVQQRMHTRAHGAREGTRMARKLKLKSKGIVRELRCDDDKDMDEAQDAVDEMAGAAEQGSSLQGQLDQAMAALSESMKQVAMLSAKVKELEAKNAAAGEDPDAEQDADAAEVPESILDAALALREDARLVLGDVDLRGKSSAEIRRMVVEKALPGARVDGKTAPLVLRGMYTAAIEGAKAAKQKRADAAHSRNDLRAELNRSAGSGEGDEDPQERMQARSAEGWKKPLGLTKGAK